MKNYLFYLITVCLLCGSITKGHAQLEEDEQPINAINLALSDLDMDAVTTNSLLDHSLRFTDWSKYDGIQDSSSNILLADDFPWVIIDIESSILIDLNPMPESSIYTDILMHGNDQGSIDLSIINWAHQKFKDDAIDQNLIGFNQATNKFFDVPNRPSSPYIDSKLFAFCALTSKTVAGLNQKFQLTDELLINNETSPTSIRVDFGNGAGFQNISTNTEISITYSSEGEKELEVEFTMPSGEVYFGKTKISITQSVVNLTSSTNGLRASGGGYDFTVEGGSDSLLNIVPGVVVDIAYNCFDDNGKGILQKPFIIIEGFDPPSFGNFNQLDSIAMRLDFMWKSTNFNAENGVTTSIPVIPAGSSILDVLYYEGYDIVYIDLVDFGASDILANADRVQTIIQWVNDKKEANNSQEENILVGTSMGGVIGYRTLQIMEQAGIPAECKYLITFDAPLRGAQIPECVQHLPYTFGTVSTSIWPWNDGIIADKVPLLKAAAYALYSDAAQQLLAVNLYHYKDADGDTVHDNFYQTLHSLPSPSTAQHIAISNGSGTGVAQLIQPGEQYLKFKGKDNNGISTIRYVELYMEKKDNNFPVYKHEIGVRILGINVYDDPIIQHQRGNQELSTAPGGTSDFGMKEAFGGTSIPGSDYGVLTLNFPSKGEFGFIPTYSALNIPTPADPMTFVPQSCPGTVFQCASSPDASVYSYLTENLQDNQTHVSVNSYNSTFLLSFIKTGSNGSEINPIENDIYNYGISDETPSFDPNAFGYFQTDNIIDFNLSVEPTGELWVNRENKVDFASNPNNKSNQIAGDFDLFITANSCDQTETLVSIKPNAQFKIGQWTTTVNTNADVYVMPKATVEVEDNAIMHVDQYSNLIIEGGKVVVKRGGLLKTAWNGKIIVRGGGELIIESGARLRLQDNAQLIVEDDGRFTFHLNSKIQLWNGSIASDNPNRCNIHIKQKGIFNYGGQPIFTGLGYIQFDKYSGITAEDNVSEFKLLGISKDEMLIQLNEGAQQSMPDVDLKLLSMRIEYYKDSGIDVDDSRRIWLVGTHLLGISNEGSFGMVGPNDNRVFIVNTTFENLAIGLLTYDHHSGTLYEVFNSKFIDNKTGVWSFNDKKLLFNNCEFNSGDRGLLLDGTNTALFYNDCLITGYRGDNSERGYQAEGGIIALVSKGVPPSISLYNSRVVGNQIGIFAPQDHTCTIGLFEESRVDVNGYGISMPGPLDNDTSGAATSGIVSVDCSSISNNIIAGVYGSGIHLMIDASQPWVGSNEFVRPTVGNGKIFDIVNADPSYCALGIASFDNYWGPNNYCPSFPQDYEITGTNQCTIQLTTYCPGELSCEEGPIVLPPCDDTEKKRSSCPCRMPATFPLFDNMNQQWNAGMKAYENSDYESMVNYLSPLGSASDDDLDTYGPPCELLYNYARALAPFNDYADAQASVNGQEITEIVSNNSDKVKLFPNPFEEKLNLVLTGKHIVKIFALDGRVVYNDTVEGGLTLSTKEWPIGTYIIKMIDVITFEITEEKVIKV